MPNQTYHGQNYDSSTATNAKNKNVTLYLEILWVHASLQSIFPIHWGAKSMEDIYILKCILLHELMEGVLRDHMGKVQLLIRN